MAKKLNRDLPFGSIVGNFHGAAYEQGGAYFDETGAEVKIEEPATAPAQEQKQDTKQD